MNPLQQVNALGQSIWYDNITRELLDGKLEQLINNDDLRGITSNPSIFQKAITSSDDYDQSITAAVAANGDISAKELFFELAIADIQSAADQLVGQFTKTQGTDGFVSLEVSPDLAHDTESTIAEARTLHARVNRQNLMIKVPATKAGIPAIEALIADDISVNVTLLFSVARYQEVAQAYIRGIKARVEQGKDISNIRSVASFFVSRVDSAVDAELAQKPELHALQGKIAIANAKSAYQSYLDTFETAEFKALNAAPQRLLWASTGTKNPEYSDVLYLDQLIAPNTVNTVPPATYEAFRDHGTAALTLADNINEAQQQLTEISTHGIDLTAITDKLEADGVKSFVDSFDDLLADLQNKLQQHSS
jgi:transaldolase/transaldolase/glucose-6-phosphate isomerase